MPGREGWAGGVGKATGTLLGLSTQHLSVQPSYQGVASLADQSSEAAAAVQRQSRAGLT